MPKFFTKSIIIPESNNIKTVEAVQLWEVRWESLHGESTIKHHKPEIEIFLSEKEAQTFATSLRLAALLWRHDYKACPYSGEEYGLKVVVQKAK